MNEKNLPEDTYFYNIETSLLPQVRIISKS